MDYRRDQGAYSSHHPQSRPGQVNRNRSQNSERGEIGKNVCPICFNDLKDIIAYQPCSHVLCFDCAVRNRVLCSKKECPVCRTECAEVVLAGHRFNNDNSTDSDQRFDAVLTAARNQGKSDPYYGFLFENIGIERAYRKMLTHSCRFCDRPFTEFEELIRHVKDRHDHHYCTVCVRQLVLFTWEHKVYMYDELLRHLEEGDPTDKNIPPHPQCQLCRFRAFDKDELFKHSKQRHQMCWVCDRDSNKVVFFKEFQELYEHLCENHYVCTMCAKPHELQVQAFSNKEALDIHMAADHGGGLDPRVLFSFERHPRAERGGRNRREQEREEAREDVENIRPPTPPPQNFNMDSSQFPALGPDGSLLVAGHPAATSGSSSATTVKGKDSGVAVAKPAVAANVPRYGAPKITETEFPSLGGGGSTDKTTKPTVAATSWANGPKLSAPPPTVKKATSSKSHKPPVAASFAVPEESFPALSGPPPESVKKHNLDWVSVPVKSKGSSKQPSNSKASKPVATSSKWDALEETTSGSFSGESPRRPETVSPRVTSQNYQQDDDSADFDNDSFPSLAAPARKSLPGMFKVAPAKTKPKHPPKVPAPAPIFPRAQQKSEKDEIAETLFKTRMVTSHDETENGETSEPAPVAPPVAKVVKAAPYKMKKDDFPTLATDKPKAQEKQKIADEIRMPDRVKLQKEVKSQWGNTVVQYETVYTYVPPVNAAERIDSIRAKVEPVEVKGKVKTLDMFQRELLDGNITALEFWMESQRILGKKFTSLMPEVIILIPNITVQQDVFEVAKVPIYGNVQVVKALSQCGTCKQIVKIDEKDGHERIHKGVY